MKALKANHVVLFLCTILTIGAFIITARNRTIKKIDFSIEFGSAPQQLLNYIGAWLREPVSGIVGIFIFNEIPTDVQIENIEKLLRRHGEEVRLFSFFHKKFKSANKLAFPHAHSYFNRVCCTYNRETLEKNYFLLLVEGQLISATPDLNLRDIHFSILKQRYPDRPMSFYFANPTRYKEHLLNRFRNKALAVNDCERNSAISFGKIEETFPTIYIVNSKCSDCDLQTILPQIDPERTGRNGGCCVIFSAYSSSSVIRTLLHNQGINITIYLDVNDNLQVLDLIIDERQRLVRIDRFETNQGLT